jgi:hypothetical protein
MNLRNRIAVTLACVGALLPAATFLIAAEAERPVAPLDLALDPAAPYERQRALLLASDAVIPPRLPRVELFAMYNREAPVPPQCYTRTESKHNPCYVCHQAPRAGHENRMDDGTLQAEYDFSDEGRVNHWLNLFRDRRDAVGRIGDDEIRRWVDGDNYSALAPRLRDAGFKGFIPDLRDLQDGARAFDDQGFARDGSQWVAFDYKPLPSTFWPTNGSTDDVMIRLPAEFRERVDGRPSRAVYRANLAVLEAAIKSLPRVDTGPLDEREVGADLDGDGRRGIATHVLARPRYVGRAAQRIVVPTVYPLGTEFLHTVRYLAVADDGAVGPSRRMKELRYMRRWLDSTPQQLAVWYDAENAEKDKGELPSYVNMGDGGLSSAMGWQVAGFIEDRAGRLRASTFEETMYCMGCHGSIGSTIDKTFSFARKRDGRAGWRYIDLRGMPDVASRGETRGEIETYLERVGGGSEFRTNPEMQARWFDADGKLDVAAVRRAKDVYELVTPSAARALLLNKAYRVIVEEQSYLYGRDPVVEPPANVYRTVAADAPTLPEKFRYEWDLRLDWSSAVAPAPTPLEARR